MTPGFSFNCPGCKRDLDIAEDSGTVPPHPGDDVRKVPAYELGARFPAMTCGTVQLSRLCKWSGAQIADWRPHKA